MKWKRKQGRLADRENRYGYLFVLPFVIGFVFLYMDLIVSSVVYSFSELSFEGKSFATVFVGLSNYKDVLTVNPDFLPALAEAAKVDGAGVWRTFFTINLPQTKAVMMSVFLLSFAWLWADTFYSSVFLRNKPMFASLVNQVSVIYEIGAVNNSLSGVMMNTAMIMMLIPLFAVYLVGQKALIQGIERSGLVG